MAKNAHLKPYLKLVVEILSSGEATKTEIMAKLSREFPDFSIDEPHFSRFMKPLTSGKSKLLQDGKIVQSRRESTRENYKQIYFLTERQELKEETRTETEAPKNGDKKLLEAARFLDEVFGLVNEEDGAVFGKVGVKMDDEKRKKLRECIEHVRKATR